MKKHAPTILYFAYGANTNVSGMAHRCPAAEPVGRAHLKNWKLVFRGVADVIPSKGDRVEGVLWKITPTCERSLDRFEGFPSLYTKEYRRVKVGDTVCTVMFYVMTSRRYISPPSSGYEETIRGGYKAFNLDVACINRAVAESLEYLDEKRQSVNA